MKSVGWVECNETQQIGAANVGLHCIQPNLRAFFCVVKSLLLIAISAPSFAASYYLSGVGNGSDVPTSSLKTAAPTRSSLPNYDPGRDSFDGLLIAKGGSGLAETDSVKYQTWLIAAGSQQITGNPTLNLWAAMKDFNNSSKNGSITAYLAHCTSSGASCTQIATAAITSNPWATSGTWIQKTATFTVGSYSIPAGRYLALKLIVSNSSGDDMWLAYDTSTYTSRVDVSLTSSNVVPANFNCVESGANASTGHLYTKLAGTAFSFDVVALKADNSVETGYAGDANKNVTVELVDGSGTTACNSRTAVSPTVSQTLTFASADAGRKAANSMTVAKAYVNLRCRVTDSNQSPSVAGCSSDNFAVRPSGFSVTSNANADSSGLSVTAAPVVKTGANFTLNAASGVVGYNNTPLLDPSKITAHSGAIQIGTLSGNFGAADPLTGTAAGTSFTYSEVGYFRLAANGVYDDSFTAVDSAGSDCTNDFSNTAVSGKYGCKFGNTTASPYFGRFIPDHFALTPGVATAGCGSTFTYFGQDGFTTSFRLTAQNTSNGTTLNYNGSFAKLGLTSWSNYVFTSTGLPVGSSLSASSTAPTGTWTLGVAAVSAKHQVSRPTTLTLPTSVSINATPIDTDGVTMTTTPVAPATMLRYGRINLGNAQGSELLNLAVPMQAEYYNGSSFIINMDDVCSVSTVSITDPITTDTLVPADSCVWGDSATSGANRCAGAAPSGLSYQEAAALSAGNFNLNLKAAGKIGSLDLSASVASWLQYNWLGTGDINPSSRATFGLYKGSERMIYFREIY